MQHIGLSCDSRKTKAWVSGKRSTMQSYCMIMPTDYLVKVVRRQMDDTDAGILFG